MRYEIRRVSLFVLSVLFVIVAAGPVGAMDAERGGDKDCARTSTGATPLIDLGQDLYQGAQGGLYGDGSNVVPDDHLTLGLFQASQIEPLDALGSPDPAGAIVLVSLGVSNTRMEFDDFSVIAEDATAPNVVLVNGSQPGKPIATWVDPDERTWVGVDTALKKASVTGEQVQAAWIKIPERIRSFDELEPFPTDAETYKQDFIQVIRNAKDRYPNLRVAYLSSRIYGGYDPNARPNPEPLAYQNGFAVKWTIEEQIHGSSALNADPRSGEVEAPWIAWGPYLWADGTTPRSDGLTWECADVQGDGTHPTDVGRRKVAIMLLEHFLSDPTASPWFSSDGIEIGDVELPPVAAATPSPTTTIFTSTSTTIAPVTTTIVPAPTTSEDPLLSQGTPRGGDNGSRGQRSSDPASGTLIIVTALLVLAVVVGVVWLVARSRSGDREGPTTDIGRVER